MGQPLALVERARGIFRTRVVRTTAWSFVSMTLSVFVGVLTARILMPEGRGLLALITALSGISVLLGGLGSNVALRRLLPRVSSPVTIRGYWRLSNLLLIVVVLIQVAFFFLLTATTALPRDAAVLSVILAYGAALFYSNQSLDVLYALGLPAQATMLNSAGTLVTLLVVSLCWWRDGGLLVVAAAYVAGALANVIGIKLTLHRRRLIDRKAPKGERELLTNGVKLLGMTIGQSLTSRADTLVLGVLSGSEQVGYYAVATTPASLLRLPAAALGQVVMHDAAVGVISRRTVWRRVVTVMFVSSPVAIAAGLSADWILLTVFGAPFVGAVLPFRVLLLAEMCFLPFLVLSRFVAANGSAWGASSSGLAGIAVLLVFCMILIPHYGAVGAAWASVAAYLTMSTMAFCWSIRVRDTPLIDKTG